MFNLQRISTIVIGQRLRRFHAPLVVVGRDALRAVDNVTPCGAVVFAVRAAIDALVQVADWIVNLRPSADTACDGFRRTTIFHVLITYLIATKKTAAGGAHAVRDDAPDRAIEGGQRASVRTPCADRHTRLSIPPPVVESTHAIASNVCPHAHVTTMSPSAP